MKKYIYGGHLAEYMEEMMEEEPEKFEKHFSRFVDEGINGEDLEDLYTKVCGSRRSGTCAGLPGLSVVVIYGCALGVQAPRGRDFGCNHGCWRCWDQQQEARR